MEAHVSEYKKRIVANLISLIDQYPIIGIINMESIGGRQLQKMRAELRQDFVLTMTKRNLIKHAFEQKKLQVLDPLLIGMPALIFTRKSPFKLASMLRKSRTPAPAKPGQIAPRDIIIPAGATPFSPGPIISELAGIGIKAGIDAGKVAIKQDFTAARAGEKIKPKVAEILGKLNIMPMEAGLNLVAVYEDGVVFKGEVLSIDESAYLGQLGQASSDAIALALHIKLATPDTIKLLIGKAHRDAIAVAESQNILTSESIKKMLSVAEHHGNEIMKKTGLPPKAPPSKEEKEFEEIRKKMDENRNIAEKLEELKEEEKAKEEIDKVEGLYKQMMKKGTLRK